MASVQFEDGGPTVRRILLGAQLRRLREAKGVTREAAGWEIRASESKISRMELGKVGFKERDVADLLTLYGVTDERERQALLELARKANAPGWWHVYGDLLPSWFQAYLGLEGAAQLIRTYEMQLVPGLLQTEDYARAVIRIGHPGASVADIERRVDLRMTRQQVLTRAQPPRLWAVMEEAVLRRPIGGREVLRNQIEHLIKAIELPNVRLQLVPLEAGGYASAGGPFTILRFADQELPDVVYVEQLNSALYLDKRDDVDSYVAAMERLCVDALSPEDTAERLREVLRELDSSRGTVQPAAAR
ncbi:MAG: helix-turn-helix transcriptional regulator [Micromonosporaceae bacterium]